MRMIDDCRYHLVMAGISMPDADQLRRISMTLHRWHEMECGIDNGCIERDETTGKAYWLNSYSGKRSPIADRETPALKRLAKIMAGYPGFKSYVQGDPRGCALYIMTTDTLQRYPVGQPLDSIYSSGIAVRT